MTLTIQQLSEETNLAVKTIRTTLVRNPTALPPRLVIPGQKKLLWLKVDVEEFYQRQMRVHGSNPVFSTKLQEEDALRVTRKKKGRPTKAEQVKKQQAAMKKGA